MLIAGDLNARCGEIQDISENDNVDFIFDDAVLYEKDDFNLYRESKDKTNNAFGLSLIELCKNYGIHIINGRSQNDLHGEITCTANNGSSIVDYFIASSKLFPLISYFEIGDRPESVHFPLQCRITLPVNVKVKSVNDE